MASRRGSTSSLGNVPDLSHPSMGPPSTPGGSALTRSPSGTPSPAHSREASPARQSQVMIGDPTTSSQWASVADPSYMSAVEVANAMNQAVLGRMMGQTMTLLQDVVASRATVARQAKGGDYTDAEKQAVDQLEGHQEVLKKILTKQGTDLKKEKNDSLTSRVGDKATKQAQDFLLRVAEGAKKDATIKTASDLLQVFSASGLVKFFIAFVKDTIPAASKVASKSGGDKPGNASKSGGNKSTNASKSDDDEVIKLLLTEEYTNILDDQLNQVKDSLKGNEKLRRSRGGTNGAAKAKAQADTLKQNIIALGNDVDDNDAPAIVTIVQQLTDLGMEQLLFELVKRREDDADESDGGTGSLGAAAEHGGTRGLGGTRGRSSTRAATTSGNLKRSHQQDDDDDEEEDEIVLHRRTSGSKSPAKKPKHLQR